MLASVEAISAGCDEAILLDFRGNIAEGPGENIFIVKKGILFTPSAGNILKGITRESVMRIARDEGIRCIEKKLKPKDLLTADEAFYTGTAAQVSAIGTVNNKKISDGKMGPVTAKIGSILERVVHGKIPKYTKWLTLVEKNGQS
jgi:branched-chain amino acid aminotransferase